MSLTVERLRELLDYDPATGIFRWRVKRKRIIAGQVAGVVKRSGYRFITIDGRTYRAHRLAWFYVYGEWPHEVDHINLNKVDNRLANLRDSTRSLNKANTPRYSVNKSGAKGVSWHGPAGRWRARVKVGQRERYLGLFDSVEEAAAAYEAAARQYFGEFARVN